MVDGRRHPLAKCEDCPLNTKDSVFVSSKFPIGEARLAVVGESPGYQEARRGVPFVGPSGQLLDQVLLHHGYSREEVFLTNVCLCRPKDNATPSKAAVAACRGRLHAELSQSGCRDVVALGGTATSVLVDDPRTITTLRVGPAKHPSRNLADSSIERVVPTWHPAYCSDPSQLVLKTDLTWIKAGDVQVGDELIGFDEFVPNVAYARRSFKPSIVTKVERLQLPCHEVVANDRSIIVSSDHKWLVQETPNRPAVWRRTADLRQLDKLLQFAEPWNLDTSYEAGYLAGFFDGEGSLSKANGLVWGQNDGPTADKVCSLLTARGYAVASYTDKKCKRYALKGKRESLRALGSLRPERLLDKAEMLWTGARTTYATDIDTLLDVGVREVVSITTTTSTFILEGFLSHNCLRNADAFPALVSDIGKLKDENTHVWNPPEWRYFDDPGDALRVIGELQGRADRLVVDIEVGVEKDLSFGHPNDYDLLCVGLAYARGKAVVLGTRALTDRTVLDALRELLRAKRIVAHNGKFDLAGLYPHLGAQELWFDTMLASYCLDERPGQHGLKVLAVERLGAPQYDLEIHKYVPKGGNYANIPREILYKYNAYDVACTWDLMELFEPAMEREGVRRVHDFLVAASNQLMFLELNGITIDRPYLNQLRGEFLLRLEEIEKTLDEIVGASINPRSPKQVKEYLDSQGVKVDKTDKDTLDRLMDILYRQGHYDANVAKFIGTLLTHRKQQKLFSTYVEGMRRRITKGRLFTTYTLHGTTSGRLASRNPNLQNVVRDKPIRRQFTVSREENVLIHGDYKQAEGRVITTLAQDEYLQGIFCNPDIDMFAELANQLYGEGNWGKEERVRVKAFFYGIGYGREPYSIGLEYGMAPKEAERRYAEFMDLIPAVARWQANIRNKVLNGEDLITPFGRKRRFWLITEENKKAVMNEALSYLPQSTASDICLSSLIDLRPMLRGRGFLRLTIHDALIAECHRDKAEEVSELMRMVMMEKGRLFTDYVPFPVDVSIGTSWDQL